MDPINPLNGLAELLRKRITSEATIKQEGRISPQRKGPGETGNSARPGVAALRNQIADTIQGIDPDDPNRNRKALRAFVENVLAWQFGANVLNDPGFADLASEVQDALERDPAVSHLLSAVMTDGKAAPR